MDRSKGFIYVATGPRYLAEAIKSAVTFSTTMPDIPLALFTDAPNSVPGGIFAVVLPVAEPEYGFGDKISILNDSPFENSVFIDTDTYSCRPCYELFDLLGHFDFAAAHAPRRESWRNQAMSTPDWFPEMNTGVIVFRKDSLFRELVRSWRELYIQQRELTNPPSHDQPAFREAVYRSKARLYILPPEYNLRSSYPYFVGGNMAVKIIHDRGRSLERAIKTLGQGAVKDRPWVANAIANNY